MEINIKKIFEVNTQMMSSAVNDIEQTISIDGMLPDQTRTISRTYNVGYTFESNVNFNITIDYRFRLKKKNHAFYTDNAAWTLSVQNSDHESMTIGTIRDMNDKIGTSSCLVMMLNVYIKNYYTQNE